MFADLPSDELEQIGRFVEVRRASRGDYLFREGEAVRGFFIVRKGTVSHRGGTLTWKIMGPQS